MSACVACFARAQKANVGVLLDVLTAAGRVTLTREDIAETRIGLAVGRLRKHSSSDVAAAASALVASWRREISGGEGSSTPAGGSCTPRASTSRPADAAGGTAAPLPPAAPATAADACGGGGAGTGGESPGTPSAREELPPERAKALGVLVKGLAKHSGDTSRVADVARDVEAVMAATLAGHGPKPAEVRWGRVGALGGSRACPRGRRTLRRRSSCSQTCP